MAASPLKLGVIATATALSSALLYLAAYWGSFNINIFEFVSFDDLVRSAIYPLFGLVLMFAVYGLVFGSTLTPDSFVESAGVLSVVEVSKNQRDNDQKARQARLRKLKFLAVGACVAWMIYVIVSEAYSQIAYAIAVFLSVLMGLHLKNSEHANTIAAEPVLRGVICTALTLVPMLSFVHGFVRADHLIFARGDFVYICEADLKSPSTANLADELRYIGKADDFFFFVQDPEITEVRVFQYDAFERMIFRHSLALTRGEAEDSRLLFWGKSRKRSTLCTNVVRRAASNPGK